MLIGLAAALMLAAASPSPGAPLREVVYSASFSRHANRVQEVFGGRRPDPYGSAIDVQTDQGTITIDILAVADDGIAVRITELFGNAGRPRTTTGVVLPDGSLNIDTEHVNDATVELLPFFGASFIDATQSLDPGAQWIRQLSGGGVEIRTTYTVSGVDGPIVTLDERRTITYTTARGNDVTVSGDVKYKPHVLAPISGTFVERTADSGPDYNEDITVNLQFRRISDTNDPAGP